MNLDKPYLFCVDEKVDSRGSFKKLFCSDFFQNEFNLVQANTARNKKSGTIRGLHFQKGEASESKIVVCLDGSIFDVLVDLNPQGSSLGHIHTFELSSKRGDCLYIPKGFAHGYQTLEDDTHLLYLHDKHRDSDLESGISPFDEFLGIPWPLPVSAISDRDRKLQSYQEWSLNEM